MAIENKNVSPSAFGAQLSPNGRFSLEANKAFETYAAALAYASTSPTVYLGKTITVYNDGTNNGVYWVSYEDESQSSLTLTKLGTSSLGDISIKKVTAEDGFSATYKLVTTVDGVVTPLAGDAINIPKDLVVSSGSIVDNPEGQPAGTYLKLVLANSEDPIYINVAKLIENPYTGDNTYINVVDGEISLDINAVKTDVLPTGSETSPHIIWSNNGWTAGKVDINTIVPTENKAENSVLAYDGTKVIWTTVEVQPELPDYTSESADKVLTTKVENGETKLTWASAGNSTTIEEKEVEEVVVEYTISAGSKSANVYSKDGVDKLLSWEQL